MTKQQIFQRPINSISSFYVLAHMLCEGYLYPLNTPIQIYEGNKTYSFCLAFNKETDKIWLAGLDVPTSTIEVLAQKLQELFVATLENLDIQIEFINICNFSEKTAATLNKKLSKYDISVKFFADPFQAYKYLIKENPAHNFPDNETVEACWDYMDTAIQYMNIQ